MTDVHITLAWILKKPNERAELFIEYGLGQEKLGIEHRRAMLTAEGKDPDEDPIIIASLDWLNSQSFEFLTAVNIGGWSGIDTRKMAEEAGCLDLYRYAYTPLSAATHSTWQHIARYNLVRCSNPLHRFHNLPVTPEFQPDTDYLYKVAKYLQKALSLFDATFGITMAGDSAFSRFVSGLDLVFEREESE